MRTTRSKRQAISTALAALWLTSQSHATTVPTGFVDEAVASGISGPTTMAFSPDGRLFVAQQSGALRVIKNGVLLASPFVSLSVSSVGERGLLGIAFDPSFSSNQYVYLYYTTSAAPIHNRISRFTASGDAALAGSELIVLELENLSATNHNGGAIHFGPDGKLYVGVGENNTPSNAQTLSTRLGKLLRINADGSIPSDNPFFGTATGANRAIWALGLRNPFSFAFQPGGTRLFINDVGQNTWEEINDGLPGSNYGWPTTEGSTDNPSFRSPLYAYPHTPASTNGCAIVGSAFYNPSTVTFPASYVGKYFFADYCSNWLKTYDPSTGAISDFASGLSTPVDIAVGPDGAIYYLNQGTSSVRRVRSSVAVAAAAPATSPLQGLALCVSLGAVGLLLVRRNKQRVLSLAR